MSTYQVTSLGRVHDGMAVVDATGEPVGTVTAVQEPGTEVRPDLPAPAAESFMSTGYLRVDTSGVLSADAYVAGSQVAAADDEVVSLRVGRDSLVRAG